MCTLVSIDVKGRGIDSGKLVNEEGETLLRVQSFRADDNGHGDSKRWKGISSFKS